MIELPLVLAGGLLGSSHCLGMCGPFALSLAAASRGAGEVWRRQLAYSAGRVFTYACAGAVAGWGGERLAHRLSPLVDAQAILSLIAGAFLVWQGIVSAGWLRRGVGGTSVGGCLSGGLLRPLLATTGLRSAFWAGMFTGFLPCGLVYAFLALAGSTGDVVEGLLTMAVFGVGTTPAMVLLGASGNLLSPARRFAVYRLAAICVIVAGLVSIVRGVSFWPASHDNPPATCPLCQ